MTEFLGPRRHWLAGVAIFGGAYTLAYSLYLRIPDQVLIERIYHHLICRPGAAIVNVLMPRAEANADANRIVSSGATLEIVRGCDGAGVWFLLMAALLAWPGRPGPRLLGLLGATLLVWLLNQARIVALYLALARETGWFTPLHSVVFPTLFVLLALAYFVAWSAATEHRG